MNVPLRNSAAATQHIATLEELMRIAEQWRKVGQRPATSDDLSRQQFQALCVAVGKPQLLLDPVLDFRRLSESLRVWALDFVTTGGRQQSLEQHKQMCALANAAAGTLRQSMLARLAEIANAWSLSDQQPDAAGPLSSGEFVAVCLAANKPAALDDPICGFLRLDGWLQEWVLNRRGMSGYVGHVVGHPDRY